MKVFKSKWHIFFYTIIIILAMLIGLYFLEDKNYIAILLLMYLLSSTGIISNILTYPNMYTGHKKEIYTFKDKKSFIKYNTIMLIVTTIVLAICITFANDLEILSVVIFVIVKYLASKLAFKTIEKTTY